MNLTGLAVSGALLLAGLLVLTGERRRSLRRAAFRWSPATSPTSRVWWAPPHTPLAQPTGWRIRLAVDGEWRALPRCSCSASLWSSLLRPLAVLGLSDALLINELLLQRLGGVITIAMGLVFLGAFPVLQRECGHDTLPATACGAPLLGAVYGWTGRRVWAPHSPE